MLTQESHICGVKHRAHFCFYRNFGQTGKRQPRLFDMGTDPKKVNLLTVNWQLFQVDELIAPTPAANLR